MHRILFFKGKGGILHHPLSQICSTDIFDCKCEFGELGSAEAGEGPCIHGNSGWRLCGIESELLTQSVQDGMPIAERIDELPQAVTLGYDLFQQILQSAFTATLQDVGEGFAKRPVLVRSHGRQQFAPRLQKQCLLHLVVKQLEMAGNVRLQRELVEDRLTEGVDRLDLQPAWRLQGTREKLSCSAQLG